MLATMDVGRNDPPTSVIENDSPTSITQNDPPTNVIQSDPPTRITQNEPPTNVIQNDPPTRITQNEPPTNVIQNDPPTRITQNEPPTNVIQNDSPTSITQNDLPTNVNPSDPPTSVTQNNAPMSITHNDSTTSVTQNDPPAVNQSDPRTGVHKGLICGICNKVYKHRGSLHHHMKRVHKSDKPHTTGSESILCKEAECSFHCRHLAQLRQHLSLEHGIEMMTEKKTFKSDEGMCQQCMHVNERLSEIVPLPTEFMEWKEEYEKDTKSSFTKVTGVKGKGETTLTYYYCNRSVFFQTKSAGKRHLKSQGSSKINAHCTAALIVTHHLLEHTILVEVCHSHYGHTQTLGHLRLPEVARQKISGQLAQGVTFERILDDIRDNVGSRFNRIHLFTRKDIANIEKAYGLKGVEKHPIDAVSVGAWIEELKTKGEDNPVLLVKSQGQSQPENCDNLEVRDFVLVLQTPLQRDMLKTFAPNRVVCVDATHGTNGYDFLLISVLVIDEFGEGFPVAWCLSNRQDQFLLINFFNRLKDKVGDIVPAWFMSDDAEQFYTAWIAVFGPGPKKLLCTWHVDRAWRTNLKSLIGDKETEARVYHNLRVLLEETSTSQFENVLQKNTLTAKTF